MDYGQTDASTVGNEPTPTRQFSDENRAIVDYMRDYDFTRSTPTLEGPCGCASCIARASMTFPMLQSAVKQTAQLKQAIEEPTMSTSAQNAALAELVGNSELGRILGEILEQNPGLTLNSVTQGGAPSEGPANFLRGMKPQMNLQMKSPTQAEIEELSKQIKFDPSNTALRELFARGFSSGLGLGSVLGLPGRPSRTLGGSPGTPGRSAGVVNGAGQSVEELAAYRAAAEAAKPEVIQNYVTTRVIPEMMKQLSDLLDSDMAGQQRLRQQRRILKRTDTLMGYVANPQKIQPRTIACSLELGIYKHFLTIQVTNKSLNIAKSYELIRIAEEALQQRQADVVANQLKQAEEKRVDELEASLKIDIAKAFDDLGNLSLDELKTRLQNLTTLAQK